MARFFLRRRIGVCLAILEDVLRNTDASDIRRRRPAYLSGKTELEGLRRDGDYKAIMSATGQPYRGSQIRPRESKHTSGRAAEVARVHLAHIPTTRSGAAVATSPEYIESRPVSCAFIRRPLDADSRQYSNLREVGILYTDRDRDLGRNGTLGVFSCRFDIADGAIRRCLESEACPGGGITKLPSHLRKVSRKYHIGLH